MSPVAIASPKPHSHPPQHPLQSEGSSPLFQKHTHTKKPRPNYQTVPKKKSVSKLKQLFFQVLRIYSVKPAPGDIKHVTCFQQAHKSMIHIHLIIITAYHRWYWGILLENVAFTVHERIAFCIYINWTCLYYSSYSSLFSFKLSQ